MGSKNWGALVLTDAIEAFCLKNCPKGETEAL